MKKLVFILPLVLFTINLIGQSVNGKSIRELDSEHILIVGTKKMMSTKVNIEIDFGQHDKMFKLKDMVLLNKEGKKVTFNSMIDALNFLSTAGYEYVNAYAISIGQQNVYHWMLRKEK